MTSSFARRILVETDEILAWNKPAGLSSTGHSLDDPDCAQFLAMQYGGSMIWALHQLDRDTSGLLLFAKKKKLVGQWQKIWHGPDFQKYYVAIVHGRLPTSQIKIDAPLRRDDSEGYLRVVIDEEQGREATTLACELSASESYSMVLVRLLTGRTHQIRAHLQFIGCPLLGETLYNSIPCGHHHRHALHSLAIHTGLPSPLDAFEAPLAEDLVELASKLDIDLAPLEFWGENYPSLLRKLIP